MLLFLFCSLPIFFSFLFLLNFVFRIRPNIFRVFCLYTCIFLWFLALYFWITYDSTNGLVQYYFFDMSNVAQYSVFYPENGVHLVLGLDGISLIFVLLTTFIFPLCIIFNWDVFLKKNGIFLLALLLLLEGLLLFCFTVLDIFFFYIFFEIILIPMFLLILLWGGRSRKIKAAFYFFFFTLTGSLLMLLGIITLYLASGSTSLFFLYHLHLDQKLEILLWFAFFCSFSVKIPMFPFHLWLPEAHVEAPTIGSVLLAGILLKLGGYGFLRFSLSLFPIASQIFIPFIFTLSILGIFYASLTALRQVDLKRIIAYSSIAHMSMVTLGLFSFTFEGLGGAILLMFGHGLVSSALFFLIGILYNRYHTRLIYYYGGLAQVMPNFAILFFFFILANVSFPGTINFISEFLIFLGLISNNFVVFFFSCFGVLFCAFYSFWLYNRIFFGDLKIQFISFFFDLTFREFFVLFPLLYFVILFGIAPNILLLTLVSGSLNNFLFI